MPATYSALMPTTRESLRLTAVPDQRMSMSEVDPFEAAGQWDAPSLAQVAEELFSDSTFAEMCERGLTMQLKRTKDGATAETRIAELAGQTLLLSGHGTIRHDRLPYNTPPAFLSWQNRLKMIVTGGSVK